MPARKIEQKRIREAKPQEERRSDLLNAAAAIFSRDGVADAKIEDITAFANVRTASILKGQLPHRHLFALNARQTSHEPAVVPFVAQDIRLIRAP